MSKGRFYVPPRPYWVCADLVQTAGKACAYALMDIPLWQNGTLGKPILFGA